MALDLLIWANGVEQRGPIMGEGSYYFDATKYMQRLYIRADKNQINTNIG